ncbi:MAG: hypothetical protein R3F43_04190 [bacterium]
MTDPVAAFRQAFFAERRALIGRLGPEAFDQGQVLYTCALTGRQIVVQDAFPEPAGGAVDAFIAQVARDWWATRRQFAGDADPGTRFEATAGLYARYLPAVGFDWCLELGAEGPARAWRVDGRQQATALSLPPDEDTFRDQTGTFFDLRHAWRGLVARVLATGQGAVAEVQPGYVVGARVGVPGDPDPAQREDPDFMENFSAWGPREYDTLEFLNTPETAALPVAQRWPEWLGPGSEPVARGEVELFALADSTAFVEAVGDLAAARGADVRPVGDEELRLSRGPLALQVEWARPYLRTLHAGLGFAEGVRIFFQPTLASLDEGFELLGALRERLAPLQVGVEAGTVAVVRRGDEVLGRWNLLTLVGRQGALGSRGVDEVLAFLGFNPETQAFERPETPLDRCPVCGDPARVAKVVRPLALLGADPRTLAGVPIGAHMVLYTRECPRHTTPLEPHPDQPLAILEAAFQAGLATAEISLAEVRALAGGVLLTGFDVGSLVLEPRLLKTALRAAQVPAGGKRHAYAFGPDTLLVTEAPVDAATQHAARVAAEDAVRGRFAGRGWPLDVARPVDLDVEALGRVTWSE